MPRIIIADEKEEYACRLQMIFVERFFNAIDLEVITDRTYFNSFFFTPRQADVLIVSENLYDSHLLRHNMTQIFVMTESPRRASDDTDDLHHIFKYSSINEIFNEILMKNSDSLEVNGNSSKTRMALVYSPNGGTGKTTLALGMGAVLGQNNKRTLYIHASHFQLFQHLLSDVCPIMPMEVYTSLRASPENAYEIIKPYIRTEGCDYIPPFKAPIQSLDLSFDVYDHLIRSVRASGEYDFIIVDTDSSYDLNTIHLIQDADRIIVVTKNDMASENALHHFAMSLDDPKDEKFVYVINDHREEDQDRHLKAGNLYAIVDRVEHFSDSTHLTVEKLAEKNSVKRIACLLI